MKLDDGVNGCMRTAASALLFLADHPRPIGGEHHYNSEHLMQIADELRKTSAMILAMTDARKALADEIEREGMIRSLTPCERDIIITALRTPPSSTRDREAIARAMVARRYPHRNDIDIWFERYAKGDRSNMSGVHWSSVVQALDDADAILSLPPTVDDLIEQEQRGNLRLIDFIADKIGLPHDDELSQDNFLAWFNRPVDDRDDKVLLDWLEDEDAPNGTVDTIYMDDQTVIDYGGVKGRKTLREVLREARSAALQPLPREGE